MPLSHPPSRLSPPPGTAISSLITSVNDFIDSSLTGMDQSEEGGGRGGSDEGRGANGNSGNSAGRRGDAPKRGYRACVHCRLRKAKCDLGDVNAPSEPPCSRCRREQRNCVFLPSAWNSLEGQCRLPKQKRRRKTGPEADGEEGSVPVAPAESRSSRKPSITNRDSVSTSQFPTTVPGSMLNTNQSHGNDMTDWSNLSMQPANQTFQNWGDSISTSMFQNAVSRSPVFPYPDLPQRAIDSQPNPTTSLQQLHTSYNSNSAAPMISPSIPGPPSLNQTEYPTFPDFTSQITQMNTNIAQHPSNLGNQQKQQFNGFNATDTGSSVSAHPSNTATTATSAGINQTTPASVDSGSTSALSPQTRSKRRQNTNPDATRRIVVANFSNETDALEILAHAATDGDDKDDEEKASGDEGREGSRKGKKVSFKDDSVRLLSEYLLVKKGILDEGVLWGLVKFYFDHHHPVLPIIQTPRIPRNPLDLPRLASSDPFLLSCLVLIASAYHHDPAIRLIHDKTWAIVRETLSDYTFGGVEASLGLVEGVLLLAEFLPRERHGKNSDDGGAGMRRTTSPRENTISLLGTGSTQGGLHGIENRRTWALTGLAIRAAYGLQLDQASMGVEGPSTLDEDRARLAWTWCYLYDRTIGLRTGLAFWSRGPSICFSGYSHISQTGEGAAKDNFPGMFVPTAKEFEKGIKAKRSLSKSRNSRGRSKDKDENKLDLPLPGGGDGDEVIDESVRGAGADSACLIQALMELTQIMTNAHDTLYPNQMRTSDLVQQGAYFRFLDAFRRALESFKIAWGPRQWQSESLKELTWCTYEMVRLYVSSFAFQAHVQRAWMRAEEEAGNADASGNKDGIASHSGSGGGGGTGGGGSVGMSMGISFGNSVGVKEGAQLFPRGSATSPDALYIYASIDAANEILSICLRLSKLGVLGYLPSRYLVNFVFGGVFALKAGYSGAVSQKESVKTRELVDRVCAALVLASPDRDHPALRYGQMLRLLSKKLDELSDQSAVPSRFPTPDPEEGETSAGVKTSSTPLDWNQLLLDHPNFRNLQQSMQNQGPGQNQQPNDLGFNLQASNASNHMQSNDFDNLMASGLAHTGMTPQHSQLGHLLNHGPQADQLGMGQSQNHLSVVGSTGAQGGMNGLEGLFDFDVDVNFNLDGFWDDFTLAEGHGFPFR